LLHETIDLILPDRLNPNKRTKKNANSERKKIREQSRTEMQKVNPSERDQEQTRIAQAEKGQGQLEGTPICLHLCAKREKRKGEGAGEGEWLRGARGERERSQAEQLQQRDIDLLRYKRKVIERDLYFLHNRENVSTSHNRQQATQIVHEAAEIEL
jgi:hypothetical protein